MHVDQLCEDAKMISVHYTQPAVEPCERGCTLCEDNWCTHIFLNVQQAEQNQSKSWLLVYMFMFTGTTVRYTASFPTFKKMAGSVKEAWS